MATLSMSRVQTPTTPTKNTTFFLKRTSTPFKSVGRETRASWGNRIYKDFNDLTYDIKYNQIKGKGQMKNKPQFRTSKKRMIDPEQKKSVHEASSPSKSQRKVTNRIDLINKNRATHPEQFDLEEEQMYSTLDTSGLCKFEFMKTIQGKLKFKTNHHLLFENQTDRHQNINNVWYNEDIEIQRESETISKSKLSCHPFQSYTQRKVFQPKPELDKFYNTRKAKLRCSPQKTKGLAKMDEITGRKEERPKESTKLSYNEYKSKKTLQPRCLSYEIARSPRTIKLWPQVILDSRGCYR